jgi:hypothetical protein
VGAPGVPKPRFPFAINFSWLTGQKPEDFEPWGGEQNLIMGVISEGVHWLSGTFAGGCRRRSRSWGCSFGG